MDGSHTRHIQTIVRFGIMAYRMRMLRIKRLIFFRYVIFLFRRKQFSFENSQLNIANRRWLYIQLMIIYSPADVSKASKNPPYFVLSAFIGCQKYATTFGRTMSFISILCYIMKSCYHYVHCTILNCDLCI